jgi:hypothetical protein
MISFLLDSLLDSLLFLLPGIRRKRERRQEWVGTVEAKKSRALSRQAYLVIFRTDDGRRKKLGLDRKEDYDLYEEGRRYAKKSGDDLPDPELSTKHRAN